VENVATLDADGKVTPSQIDTKDIEITASCSLLPAHNNRRLRFNNSVAITITIQPKDTGTYNYAAEHETVGKSVGTGQVSVVLASGVTSKATTPANLDIDIGGSVVFKMGADNVWDIDGAMEA
jgi:hypothetical protein